MSALERRNSANLDLLRAVAVAAVFVNHLADVAWHNLVFEPLGRFGVVLFFVHTSCVLMASLDRIHASNASASGISLAAAFWIRRLFRIYPLAVVCVLIVAICHVPFAPFGSYQWIGLKGFLSNLALCQNLTSSRDILYPLWSLPLEVQMYALLPFAYFAIRKGRHGSGQYGSVGLWLLSFLPVFAIPNIALHPPLRVFLFAPCFAAGIVAFDLSRSSKPNFRLPSWVWPLGVFALLAISRPYDPAGASRKFAECWGLALGVGLLFPFVKDARENWIYKGCRWIAERSYGIYLTHVIVLWFVFNRMEHSPLWLQIPVLIAGVLGVPALLYAGLEKPLVQVGMNIAKGSMRGSRAEAVAAVG